MRLDFLIRRRGTDPAAETALHALRDLMHVAVFDVVRGTLWRFDVEDHDDVAAVQAVLQRAASRAGRYVNTNRDACAWLDATRIPAADNARPGCAVSVWVTSGDGKDEVAREYFATRTGERVTRARRGTFYCLWTAERDPETAREQILDVAVTRTRQHGLLSNPHHESVEVLAVAPTTKPVEAT